MDTYSHIDDQINNIIQDIKSDKITESILETIRIIDRPLLRKYHVTDITDITDFIDGEYYDYLTTIKLDVWSKYKQALTRGIGRLEISDIRVLKLFMDKLSITHKVLFTKVKKYPSNQPLVMCCVTHFNEEFVKSISMSDMIFFRTIIRNGDLEYNKYLYHNVYRKTNYALARMPCVYEQFFPPKAPISSKYITIRNYDVFEYFVKLFDTVLYDSFTISNLTNYVTVTCNSSDSKHTYYGEKSWYGTKPNPNACDILRRLVNLSGTLITDVKNYIESGIKSRYDQPLYHKYFLVRLDYAKGFFSTFIQSNRIDELIEMLDYLGVDLKKYNSNIIVYMLIDVIFSNDPDIIVKFIRYLKDVVGYTIGTEIYSHVIGLLGKKNGSYEYLATNNMYCNSLTQSVVDELFRLKYAGSVIKFVHC